MSYAAPSHAAPTEKWVSLYVAEKWVSLYVPSHYVPSLYVFHVLPTAPAAPEPRR